MIALKYSLPLVRNARGTAVALESTWLRVAIQDAAGRAGYQGWWLVDDLVAGISLYLRNCYVKNVIDLPELEHMVRAALRNIGYEEVASCFHYFPPTCGVSLLECLKNTSASTRSTFFEKLAEAITGLHESEARHFHFYGLYACADQLGSEDGAVHKRHAECLREKIVSFVREHVRSRDWHHQVWCSIS